MGYDLDMGEVIKFPAGSPDRREPESTVVHMQDGVSYDLDPPSEVGGKPFDRVECKYQVPNNPNEYVVSGVPRGGAQIESFVLRFTKTRGTHVAVSKEQGFEEK